MWDPLAVQHHFSHLQINEVMDFSLPSDKWEVVHASRYGTIFSEAVLLWLQTLKWPEQPETRKPPIGITFFELTVNFLLTSQMAIPLQIDGRLIDVDSSGEWTREQVDINRWALTLQSCIMHLQYLTQQQLMPPTSCSHVSALYRLGGGAYKHGISRRPMMERQVETIQCTVDYLHTHMHNRKTLFSAVPHIPKLAPVF